MIDCRDLLKIPQAQHTFFGQQSTLPYKGILYNNPMVINKHLIEAQVASTTRLFSAAKASHRADMHTTNLRKTRCEICKQIQIKISHRNPSAQKAQEEGCDSWLLKSRIWVGGRLYLGERPVEFEIWRPRSRARSCVALWNTDKPGVP